MLNSSYRLTQERLSNHRKTNFKHLEDLDVSIPVSVSLSRNGGDLCSDSSYRLATECLGNNQRTNFKLSERLRCVYVSISVSMSVSISLSLSQNGGDRCLTCHLHYPMNVSAKTKRIAWRRSMLAYQMAEHISYMSLDCII